MCIWFPKHFQLKDPSNRAANVFSHFGPVINPHGSGAFDNESCKRRVAGGSSGGSAAAVAAKMCVAYVPDYLTLD